MHAGLIPVPGRLPDPLDCRRIDRGVVLLADRRDGVEVGGDADPAVLGHGRASYVASRRGGVGAADRRRPFAVCRSVRRRRPESIGSVPSPLWRTRCDRSPSRSTPTPWCVRCRQRSLLDLRDAGRMGQHEFDPVRRRHPQVAGLRVQRAAVVAGLRPLAVNQERLADVTENHFLDVAERFDRRVLACALDPPRCRAGGPGRRCRDGGRPRPSGYGRRALQAARGVAGPRNVPSWPSTSPAPGWAEAGVGELPWLTLVRRERRIVGSISTICAFLDSALSTMSSR